MGFHSSANLEVMSLVVKGVVFAEEFLLATNQVSRLAYTVGFKSRRTQSNCISNPSQVLPTDSSW